MAIENYLTTKEKIKAQKECRAGWSMQVRAVLTNKRLIKYQPQSIWNSEEQFQDIPLEHLSSIFHVKKNYIFLIVLGLILLSFAVLIMFVSNSDEMIGIFLGLGAIILILLGLASRQLTEFHSTANTQIKFERLDTDFVQKVREESLEKID